MKNGGTAEEAAFTTVKSADRVLVVLELLAGREPMRLMDIADELEMPRSSTSNLLRTMARRRFVEYDEGDKRYRIGSRMRELARASEREGDLVSLAQPLMDRLVEQTGETVQLAQLEAMEVVYLAISESPHPMKLVSEVGKRLFAHGTGVGKTLLAQLDLADAEQRLRSVELPRFTPATIIDVDDLLDGLREIGERGYGTDDEEYVLGCRCIAMPVHGPRGDTIAAMSVSIPTPRYDDEVGERALEALRSATAELSRQLGWVETASGAAVGAVGTSGAGEPA
ncbi:IclR family transcriptional regulator [Conexibacter woesei]|uniref:Transcriptional regulator, IclR family n=1 Tax=Conexibacter woesei (strain DSM 14684 / CCUG 47730 / CIP 108061 / JCM 11494 / NBRC 100937 / ID131577) TaxID=469383 RepID=D3F536_CONWI|nr:IclR family transcriptional regulator [Conexibacter woesei]ADB48614.1 transcriptional regulator, IclR family [Conexibacter woesei DSM 14684]